MSMNVTSRRQLFGALFVLGWLLSAILIRQHYIVRQDIRDMHADQPFSTLVEF